MLMFGVFYVMFVVTVCEQVRSSCSRHPLVEMIPNSSLQPQKGMIESDSEAQLNLFLNLKYTSQVLQHQSVMFTDGCPP